MIETKTQDKRPAIAYDNKEEVQLTLDALQSYRYNHIDKSNLKKDEQIRRLEDEYEKVLNMFYKEQQWANNQYT